MTVPSSPRRWRATRDRWWSPRSSPRPGPRRGRSRARAEAARSPTRRLLRPPTSRSDRVLRLVLRGELGVEPVVAHRVLLHLLAPERAERTPVHRVHPELRERAVDILAAIRR